MQLIEQMAETARYVEGVIEVAYVSCLPCDACGREVQTVGAYLSAAAKRKAVDGFYSDLVIRLCEECIDKAKDRFKQSRLYA